MEVQATAKYQRIGARKVRMVVDVIRGAGAEDALSRLKFMPQKAARMVEKVLKSAVANAEDREVGDVDELVVTRAWVDQGPTLKRIRARAQGRANRILKPTSHITIVVSPKGASA
ncbi:MAG: 50S ribosomal protein L22 [Leptospirillia bacterium]